MRRTMLTIGLLFVIPHGDLADAATRAAVDVTGEWNMRWPTNTRRERDGSMTVLEWREGELSLEQAGDSLLGLWRGVAHWRVAGRVEGSGLAFRIVEFVSQNGNRPPSRIADIRWTATLSRDSLIDGIMQVQLTPRTEQPGALLDLPWAAVRRTASDSR